jgi:glutathione peroxidase
MFDRLVATVAGAAALATGLACSQAAPRTAELDARWKDASLFDLKATALDGGEKELAEYRGKVALVVNVASQCGFTGQYAGLQKLADKYRDKGLVVLGFPSGDFGGQEFATSKEIRDFCDTKYRVTFPMFEKCRVKAGEGQSQVFECLGTKTGELPGWNFGKYVVSRDGKTAAFFPSTTGPDSAKLVEAIEKALAEAAPADAATKDPAAAPATKAG